MRPASFDGDTPMVERDWVRAHSRWVFTNPDMLHRGLLPNHARWSTFFRRLTYVVVDECHSYRGVFGSHVALLHAPAAPGRRQVRGLARVRAGLRHRRRPRRLRRAALRRRPVEAIDEDASPRGERTVALWEPPLLEELAGENGAPIRRAAGTEAARILADLVIEKARTLAFVRSRRGAELTALTARRILAEVDDDLAGRVAAYRAGFLPEERRALERSLSDGRLLGVATTNALELGVDIAGLDAVVVAGYPGTLASFWQQAGRAGRTGDGSLVVFVARDDPLDTYLVHHPAAVLDKPVEATVLDPVNPYVLAPQLACAAAELPLTADCLDDARRRRRPGDRRRPRSRRSAAPAADGWYWTSRERPHAGVDIRGSGGEQIAVVEGDSGRMLGTVDPGSATWQVHPGALYLHQGTSYVVDDLLTWRTASRSSMPRTPSGPPSPATSSTSPSSAPPRRSRFDGVDLCLGEVDVTSQVVGYLRKLPSGRVIDQVPLDLPEQTLRTRAVWYTVSQDLLEAAGIPAPRVPGSLHAAEHAAIGLLPLFATCDRWDIGGVSTAMHADTGEATVFVHDGHPGGAGFADRGHAALVPWLTATREAIASCECLMGCPSCVQSPKCGNGNEPLDKAGAVAVLTAVLDAIAAK